MARTSIVSYLSSGPIHAFGRGRAPLKAAEISRALPALQQLRRSARAARASAARLAMAPFSMVEFSELGKPAAFRELGGVLLSRGDRARTSGHSRPAHAARWSAASLPTMRSRDFRSCWSRRRCSRSCGAACSNVSRRSTCGNSCAPMSSCCSGEGPAMSARRIVLAIAGGAGRPRRLRQRAAMPSIPGLGGGRADLRRSRRDRPHRDALGARGRSGRRRRAAVHARYRAAARRRGRCRRPR